MDPNQTYFFGQAKSVVQRVPLVSFITMAARFGDVDTLRKLLPEAVTADPCFLTSSTLGLALKRATQAGHINVLQCLVDAGADINTEFKGASALHEAVKVNNVDVLRYLLSVPGMERDSLSTAQKTPVMEAACRGRVQCLTVLLEHGCSKDAQNSRGQSAVHYCLLPSIGTLDPDDMTSCLDLLLQRGADIDAQDANGSTPLHVAVATENLDAVQWLLRRNCRLDLEASPTGVAPGVFSCLGNRLTLTPLLLAVHFSNRRLVQLLVSCGASCRGLSWALEYCRPYERLHQFLERSVATPASLQTACRSVVRQVLKDDVEAKVSRLTCLPLSVQRYILLTEELQQA